MYMLGVAQCSFQLPHASMCPCGVLSSGSWFYVARSLLTPGPAFSVLSSLFSSHSSCLIFHFSRPDVVAFFLLFLHFSPLMSLLSRSYILTTLSLYPWPYTLLPISTPSLSGWGPSWEILVIFSAYQSVLGFPQKEEEMGSWSLLSQAVPCFFAQLPWSFSLDFKLFCIPTSEWAVSNLG